MTYRGATLHVSRILEATVVGFALALALFAAPHRASAGSITVGAVTQTSADPKSIVFKVSVTAPAGLQSATLDYKLFNPDTTVGGSQPAEVNDSTAIDATVTLTGGTNANATVRGITTLSGIAGPGNVNISMNSGNLMT